MISSLKSLFPDYGDAFLLACLTAYDMSLERCIDALLQDNLPPHLSKMDRSVKMAWIGKRADESDSSKPGKISISQIAAGVKSGLSPSERLLERQRNRAYESRLEEDAEILQKEYGDDYDDQVSI